jgi:hypothetical protein
LLLALPLEYLHDYFRLPRIDFPGAFAGGDADLEPDLDPARPFPLISIIADHTVIRGNIKPITGTIISVIRVFIVIHVITFPGVFPCLFFRRRKPCLGLVPPVTVGHP